MINTKVIEMLEEIADLLEMRKDNPFKIRSYRLAARNIGSLDIDLRDLHRQGRLRSIPGVGSAISDKIAEIIDTGELRYLQRLRQEILGSDLPLVRLPSKEEE